VRYLGIEKDMVPELSKMNAQLLKFNTGLGHWTIVDSEGSLQLGNPST
jgi:hypothetical protein